MVRLGKLVDLTPWNRFTYRLWSSDREGSQTMPQKRDRSEGVIAKLREAQVLLRRSKETGRPAAPRVDSIARCPTAAAK